MVEQQPDTAQSYLAVARTVRAGVQVVSLSGDLDMTTVDRADEVLTDAVDRGGRIVLDLTGLRFFASAGLNLLVRLHQRQQRDSQLSVRLAGEQRAVLRPLALMGLLDLFPVNSSVDDAVAALAD